MNEIAKDYWETLIADLVDMNDCCREFELSIALFVQNHFSPNDAERLEEILDNQSENRKTRYCAFYALNVYYREQYEIHQLEKLINRYKAQFKDFSSLKHLQAMYYSHKGDVREYQTTLSLCADAMIHMPDNAGVLHHAAESYARFGELFVGSQNEIPMMKINDAIKIAQRAIELDPKYAKYYCTLGRLQTLYGQYTEAIYNMNTAIRLEKSNRKDYALRIGDYQMALTNAQISRNSLEMRQKVDSLMVEINAAEEKLKKSNIKNLEFISIFAGVVSFIIASIQITNNRSSEEAAFIILNLILGLVILTSGFSFTLNGLSKQSIPSIVLIFISITLLLLFNLVL